MIFEVQKNLTSKIKYLTLRGLIYSEKPYLVKKKKLDMQSSVIGQSVKYLNKLRIIKGEVGSNSTSFPL